MKILRNILVTVFSILYCLCVGACVYLLINYINLREKFDLLSNTERQYISQIADYEMEIKHLNGEIESLQNTLQEMTENEKAVEDSIEKSIAVHPGDILPDINLDNFTDYFSINDIRIDDEIYNRIVGKSYRENSSISLDELKYLQLLHYNFQHEVQVGEMIVNSQIAEDVINIFKELFINEYEIQSIYLVDNYWTGDPVSTDTASIENNNTSCFNYREVTGGSNLSNHAYGCAIDINPQQNPYVWYGDDGSPQWTHSNAAPFVERNTGLDHVITSEDICYTIFSQYGFEWGGNWEDPIDYQHFQKKLY